MRPVPEAPGAGVPAGKEDVAWCARVFVALALVMVAIMPSSNVAYDGASMYAVTEGLLHGTLHVSCNLGVPASGGCVSSFYPLLSFVMVPFAVIGHGFAALSGLPASRMGELFSLVVSALSTAAAGALCAALALRLGAGRSRAVLAAVTCALGTEMLTYSRTLFAEALGAACLACAVWGVVQPRPWPRRIGLIACTACVLAKPQLGLAVLCIAVALAYSARRRQPALKVVGALVVGIALYLLYNLARTGDPLNFSRSASGSVGHESTVLGFAKQFGVLLISPNNGVLWYSPVVLIGAYGLWRARRNPVAIVCLAAAAGVLLIYLPQPYGNAWGTRYLVPAMPLLCAGVAILPRRAFRVALVLAAVTLVGQLPNIAGNYDRYLYAKPTVPWTLKRVQLIGVWSSAIAQVRDAIDEPPRNLVDEVARNPIGGGRGFRSVALWWWLLPAAGIPAVLGLMLSLIMIGAGLLLLRRTARAGPRPAPAAT